jgi:hypothetical protein
MVESGFKVSPGRAKDLPNFAQPPVVEVALGVQFDPLSRLDTPWIARFWLEESATDFLTGRFEEGVDRHEPVIGR